MTSILQSQKSFEKKLETMKSKSFFGVTLHFLEGNKILDITLGIYELDERHTSEYIAEMLKKLCQEWKIPDEKISCVVTDGAANMVKAIDIAFGKQRHIICFAYILNLVVTKAIERSAELCQIIKKVKDIVKWFKQSVIASDVLWKAQKDERGENQLTLKQNVVTRWNSTFSMLQRFLKLRVHINTIVNIDISAPTMLSAREIKEIEAVVNLLQSLESATREISGSKYTTSSIVIPFVGNIQMSVKKIIVDNCPIAAIFKDNFST